MSTPSNPTQDPSLPDDPGVGEEFDPCAAAPPPIFAKVPAVEATPPIEKPPPIVKVDADTTRHALNCIKIMGRYFQKEGVPTLTTEFALVEAMLADDPVKAVEALMHDSSFEAPWDELAALLLQLRPTQRREVLHEIRRILGRMFATAALFEQRYGGG